MKVKVKSEKYLDGIFKRCFSHNPAVLFSPFFPAIWWPFYILLPFIALVPNATAYHQTKVLNDSITVCMTVQLTNRSVPHIEDLEVQEEEENCEQLLLTYLLLCTAILCD